MAAPAAPRGPTQTLRSLVTGGAGFIGCSIVRALLDRGHAVVVLDDLSSGHESNLEGLKGELEVIRADIRDPAAVERACRGVHTVFHHAAMASVEQSIRDPMTCDDVNVRGTLLLLETARQQQIPRFVFAASSAAYGDDPELPKHESMPPAPLSPYAASKVAAEQYVRVYARLHGMSAISLRYFNVFGPRQDPGSPYAAVIPKFISALLSGDPPTIHGDGQQTRDFCYIDNVVEANLRAAETERAEGQVVNVASGRSIDVNALLSILQGTVGTEMEARSAAPRPGDVRHSSADIGRARELLGFEPRISVEEGLRHTVEWSRTVSPRSALV